MNTNGTRDATTTNVKRADRRRGRRTATLSLAMVTGLVGSGLFVWQGTQSAFSTTTDNPNNVWTALNPTIEGQFDLWDNDGSAKNTLGGTAMFDYSLTGTGGLLVPGMRGEKCITVSYQGRAKADIRMYAENIADDAALADAIKLKVEYGTGTPSDAFGDCTGFTTEGVQHGTGTGVATAADSSTVHSWKSITSWAGATQNWKITTGIDGATTHSRRYRISWILPDSGDPTADNALMGKIAKARFVWQAQTNPNLT